MFETLKINLLGKQPVPKITKMVLKRIVERDFSDSLTEIKVKLDQIESDTESGKNRISAAILKLSNGNLKSVDEYIRISKVDFRDVISQAEYPRCSKLEFEDLEKPGVRRIYFEDWKEYSEWLNG
jgi:hypothetical protein